MRTTSGPTINLGGIDVAFLVEAADSGGAATVFECAVAEGAMEGGAADPGGRRDLLHRGAGFACEDAGDGVEQLDLAGHGTLR